VKYLVQNESLLTNYKVGGRPINLEDGDGVGHDEVDAGGLLEEHVAQGQQERLHYRGGH
jgi:hypothetical protein